MSSDSYKIIISLSHHRISFEYWQRDGENKLVPMPNMSWPAPLAFYCSPTGIEIGDIAMRAVHSGTSNAFDNYFDQLSKDETYLYGGQRKPLRYLLLDACESIFEDFFRKVLFGNKGSLSDNRATMPITLVCESDIKPNERVLLLDLFKSSGYNRFKVVEYNTFIEQYIRTLLNTEYDCNHVLVAWTEGDDLTFTIFDRLPGFERRQVCFPGLGVDPRLNYVKELIWDRIKGQNPWLNQSSEEEVIGRAAAVFLSSSAPLVNGTLILSDGVSYHYSLNRGIIDTLQGDEGVEIRTKLEDFLRENNISNRNNILLFLRGIAAGNTFFENTICQGFTNTIRTDKKLRNNTMQLLIADPNPIVVQDPSESIKEFKSPHQDESQKDETRDANGASTAIDNSQLIRALRKGWREIKAQSSGLARNGRINDAIEFLQNFKVECQEVKGSEDLVSEIESKIYSLDHLETKEIPIIDSSAVKAIEREWRELRAIAKGKARSGQTAEAKNILNEFLQRISAVPGVEVIIENVLKEISQLNPSTNNSKPSHSQKHFEGEIHPNGKWVWVYSAAGGKGDWRTISGRIHQQAQESTKVDNNSSLSEGEKLVAAGRLKEARDWYRSTGNTSKARLLSDLIRSQKGVELRKSSFEECRRTRNREQIKRIILELQDYISLCDEVKHDCTEYKILLSEYKKLLK